VAISIHGSSVIASPGDFIHDFEAIGWSGCIEPLRFGLGNGASTLEADAHGAGRAPVEDCPCGAGPGPVKDRARGPGSGPLEDLASGPLEDLASGPLEDLASGPAEVHSCGATSGPAEVHSYGAGHTAIEDLAHKPGRCSDEECSGNCARDCTAAAAGCPDRCRSSGSSRSRHHRP
jgi:hypothetical protein